jgi:hypothetical protein
VIDKETPSKMSLDEMADLALAMARHEAETLLKMKKEQVQEKPNPGLRRGDERKG